ncbi:MAG: DUF5063 domain-containing protein [Bacteroidales bacterium]|nr:DUF5063 domain-containing protein [Bacteroidales bacterium]
MQISTTGNETILKSRQVLDMITVANDFTLFVEKAGDYTREQILVYFQRVLPAIYLKASLLPDVQVADEDAVEHYVTQEQWEQTFNEIREKLGQEDIFYFIDLHEKSQHDAIRASIAEGITDLYQDLKDFLLLIQKPQLLFQENAVKECRRLFETRYGYKIVNCHAAIHYLLYQEGNSGGGEAEYLDIL